MRMVSNMTFRVGSQSHRHLTFYDTTREEVFNRIANRIGKQPISCNCEKCRQMCQRTPCLGTPQDILAIIEAGYVDKVCYTEWAAGMYLGHITRPIEMVQIKSKGKGKDGECVFFHDGKCWYTGTADSRIMLFEIDPMTGKKLSKEKEIWRGTGGRYPEGPHLYFKDGWYYLLIAEGGTEYAHMITIARSRNIDGPYEGNPGNPILTHCKMSTQGSQIQGLGHGDFVQAADGSWWMACLGFRRQGGDHHLLGRETFMAPVEWDKDGWPVVNGNGELQLRMDVPTLPQVECRKAPSHMDFSKDRTGDEWIYLRNPFMENYSFTGTSMRLTSNGKDLDETHVSPTFTGRRQEDIFFSAITSLTAEAGAEAGLTVFMDVGSHYDIFIEDGVVKVRYRLGEMTHLIKAKEGIGSGKVWLKVEGNEYNYVFSFSTDGLEYKRLCQMTDFYTFDYSMIPR